MKRLKAGFSLLLVFFAAIYLTSCGQGDSNSPNQSDLISECGGFEAGGTAVLDTLPDYCDAEVLHWMYEAGTGTLKLADTRIHLNCCGEHSMKVVYSDGVYVVTETDRPVDGDARCLCSCVFDFAVTVYDVPPGTTRIKILRIVTDQNPRQELVYEGELDLLEGSGFVVVDESKVPCDIYKE